MKCKMIALQMEIRLSYLKLVRSHELGCIFGLSLNLTAVAKSLEKFLIPITMNRDNDISSSEDEFYSELLNKESTAIHREREQ